MGVISKASKSVLQAYEFNEVYQNGLHGIYEQE